MFGEMIAGVVGIIEGDHMHSLGLMTGVESDIIEGDQMQSHAGVAAGLTGGEEAGP